MLFQLLVMGHLFDPAFAHVTVAFSLTYSIFYVPFVKGKKDEEGKWIA